MEPVEPRMEIALALVMIVVISRYLARLLPNIISLRGLFSPEPADSWSPLPQLDPPLHSENPLKISPKT
jgi:hypothetical protein